MAAPVTGGVPGDASEHALLVGTLERELGRVVDRLRQCSVELLAAPARAGPWSSRAAAAAGTAQVLADLCQDLEEGPGARRRALPGRSAAAAADLVAVPGHDLLLAARAARAVGPATRAAVRSGADALIGLRHAL